jgi:DNA-binding NarL/FixJ family response regulator
MVHIGIVDDNSELLDIMSNDLTSNGDIDVVCTAEHGIDYLAKLKLLQKRPEIVLMDVEMPRMDGVETVQKAKALFPEITYIMLSVIDDEDVLYKALKAGAEGYFLKEEPIHHIVEKLKEVQKIGHIPFSPAMASKVLNLAKWSVPPAKETADEQLTNREIEILELLADGHTSNEIGEQLFISFHTVRKHIRNIYLKLQVNTQAEAVKEGFLRRVLGFKK